MLSRCLEFSSSFSSSGKLFLPLKVSIHIISSVKSPLFPLDSGVLPLGPCCIWYPSPLQHLLEHTLLITLPTRLCNHASYAFSHTYFQVTGAHTCRVSVLMPYICLLPYFFSKSFNTLLNYHTDLSYRHRSKYCIQWKYAISMWK